MPLSRRMSTFGNHLAPPTDLPRYVTSNGDCTVSLSPCAFNTIFRDWLVEHGWKQCICDPCIYTFRTGDIFAIIALHVDDIPTACNDRAWMQAFKTTLGVRFKIKDMGDLSQLLGMHTTRDMSARTMSMDQSKCVKDILVKHNMSDCKPSSLPMQPGFLSGLAHIDSPLLT
jgi:hypothetical protein